MIARLLIEGVARVIAQQFGDAYSIYTEHVEQGFEKPCFYLKLLSSNRQEYMDTRQKRQYLLDIHYFPSEEQQNQHELAGILYSLLKQLPVTEQISLMGRKMYTETEDGVLHFFVSYDWIAYEPEDVELMEELEYQGGMKE